MKRETVFLTMSDGVKIAQHRWIPDGEVKGLVQLSHGMAEYAKRYDRFGKALTDIGFVLYAHDHRGHGETAGPVDKLGYLADNNGFQRVVLDLQESIQNLKDTYPNKKIFLMGHSFGSFISQSFIEQFGNQIDGCILSGTAGPRLLLTNSAKVIALILGVKRNPHRRSLFLNNLAFGAYNNKIESPLTDFDWLSRDNDEVKKYIESDYCGFLPTISFFYDMFTGLSTIHKKANIKKIPVELPIYFIAGESDPVGDYTKTVKNLFNIYKGNGIKDLSIKTYPGARHELLNETNKEEVTSDIIAWLNEHNK